MPTAIDARGLSCPQPVLLFLNRVKVGEEGPCEILVDNEVSLENVSRAATAKGFAVQVENTTGSEARILATKK